MDKILTAYKESTRQAMAWWQTLNINSMDRYADKYFRTSFETLRPLQIKYIYSAEVKGVEVGNPLTLKLRAELDAIRIKYTDKLTRNTINDEFEGQIGK